jgi:YHS domain-containing protein
MLHIDWNISMNKRHFLFAAAALAIAPAGAIAGQPEVFTGLVPGVAVGGYDAVSYFNDGGPKQGAMEFMTEWKGAKWYFSSAENLAAFQQNPEAYAPQYGGYCAYAVSQGATAKGEPEAWSVVDGKLYLNFSKEVRGLWREDIPGNIAKANDNWPKVLN